MVRPGYLKKGDAIAVVATAKRIEFGQIDGALEELADWGLRIMCGPRLYSEANLFAGTDSERASDLQWALNDPEIKAVIFARGGYGTARIIDAIDWGRFLEHPKWLCGFSDLTALHSHVYQNLGIETLHSTMPIFFKDGVPNPGSESLRNALFGSLMPLQWEGHDLNRSGAVNAPVVGGNLSVLISLMGTSSQLDFDGKILFLEDLSEYIYHLDRMMLQLDRAGILANLAGMVVGQFTEMNDGQPSFGKTAEQCIASWIDKYQFPVAFNAPIGHVENNLAILHGATMQFNSDRDGASLLAT